MTENENDKKLIDEAEHRQTENPTVGTEMGYEVSLAIRRVPSGALYPDDFGVNLYIAQEGSDNIDIARVDTSHGDCHIDRLYLPQKHEQRKHDKGFQTDNPEGAVKYMTEEDRWRDWVRRYDKNHGLP
ncbi:hypothetical protein ABNG02_14405 [Halorubrum ejinorense]|uniref:DUF7718 domain-containing protein n=1 Tax=Halorubrum ejinorense TaxID=425309 RepID=A0AAV3SRF8_9EURY